MINSIYQGDPKITITENGSEITFIGGQPVMDNTVYNPAVISLFSDSWCGNVLFDSQDQKLNSNFVKKMSGPIVSSLIGDARDAAIEALDWMRTQGIIKRIYVEIRNPESNKLIARIALQNNDESIYDLVLEKNGPGWTVR